MPPGRFNVVTGRGQDVGLPLVTDKRVRLITFTGGVATGEEIARAAGLKKLSMELGSSSPVIVQPDAQIERAVPAIVAGAFAQAGQNCLGVQRVFVHDAIYDRFKASFVAQVSRLKAGSSLDETVDVCAVIDAAQAARVEAWIGEAVGAGARLLADGPRERAAGCPARLRRSVRTGRGTLSNRVAG